MDNLYSNIFIGLYFSLTSNGFYGMGDDIKGLIACLISFSIMVVSIIIIIIRYFIKNWRRMEPCLRQSKNYWRKQYEVFRNSHARNRAAYIATTHKESSEINSSEEVLKEISGENCFEMSMS